MSNLKPLTIIMPVLVLMLALVVACGSAAEPQKAAPAAPAAGKQQAATPVAKPAAAAEPATTVKHDRLVVLTESFGNEVWDIKYESGDKHIWHHVLHSRLLASNADLEYVPDDLATKWEVTDGGKGLEFTIREGHKFHNGDPLTVDDATFSNQYIIDENSRSVVRVRLWRVIEKHAHKTGPNTFKVLFKQPTLNYFYDMSETGGGNGGAVISKKYFESLGADAQARSDGFSADPNPGSSGPFNLVKFTPADEILYEKIPDHYILAKRDYPFDELQIRLVQELSTRVAALRAGDAHIIPADLEVEDQIEQANARIIYGPESTVIWINAWNCSKDAPQTGGKDLKGRELNCSDKRVRHALDYAIDKQAIQDLLGGPGIFEIKGTAGVSPSGVGYIADGTMDPFPYDPEKAKALFQEAGYKVPGSDTGIEPNYGEPWQVWTWPGGATVPKMIEMVQLVCDDWRTVLGLDCNVNVGEEASIKDKQYGGEIPGQYLVRSNEHSYDIGSKYRGRYGDPEGSYISFDPLMEPLVLKMLSQTDPAERKAAYATAHRQAHAEGHWDFAPGYLNAPYGVTNDIAEWIPRPLRPSPSALWTIKWAD